MIKNECNHAYKLLDHAECLWCEDCVEKLARRLKQKPGVTNKWIEEKTMEMIDIVSKGKILESMTFIRSIVKEIG